MVSRQRKWQLKKMKDGLCEKCGKQARENRTMCPGCSAKDNKRSLAAYYARKENNANNQEA